RLRRLHPLHPRTGAGCLRGVAFERLGVDHAEGRRCDALWPIAGGLADPGWTAHPFWIVHLGESPGARGQGTTRSSVDVQESATRWWADDVPLPVFYPGWHLFHDPLIPLDRARTIGAPDWYPTYTTVACAAGVGNRGSTALAKGVTTARGACGTSPASSGDSPADRSTRRGCDRLYRHR